jgi:hypothetical protein
VLQFLLQHDLRQIPHEQADFRPLPVPAHDTYTCSCGFRPKAHVQYEHMFSSTNPSPLARHLFGALHLIRSFLLLEDGYEVDWEVDQHECGKSPGSGLENPDHGVHPHRPALRSRLGARRPGAGVPREQVCLCPLPARMDSGKRDVQRGSRITTGSVRVAIDR